MKNKKLLYTIFALALVLVAVVAFFAIKGILDRMPSGDDNGGGEASVFRETEPTQAADIQFKDMDGGVHNLSDFEGKKVVVNFWAVFCPPCVEEMPDFDKAVSELEKMNAVIVALNVVEPKDEIEQFLDELKINNLDIYMDIKNNASITYSIDTIPRTIIIDEEGVIRYAARGAVTYDDLLNTVEKID